MRSGHKVGSHDEFDIARLKQAPERGEDRTSMFLQAELQLAGSPDSEICRVRNVSAGGVMCETQSNYATGQRVSVTLRTVGRVEGTVVWTSASRVGVAFDESIEPGELRRPVVPRP